MIVKKHLLEGSPMFYVNLFHFSVFSCLFGVLECVGYVCFEGFKKRSKSQFLEVGEGHEMKNSTPQFVI